MFFNFKGESFLFLFENVVVIVFNGVKSKFMLFICMGIVVDFVYFELIFYLFDFYVRDLNGMLFERGICVFGILNNIIEICLFLRRLVIFLCILVLIDI